MNPFWLLFIGMAVVVGGIAGLRLHAFLALVLGSLVVAGLTPVEVDAPSFVSRVTAAFGTGCGKMGIVIAMAAIIGVCLLESGAAERIVTTLCARVGEKRTPVAFSASAFVLGIPVFFDTVFYLLIPLGRAMVRRTGRNYLLVVLSIVAGATMAHSLVPPTPGPLLAASELGVDVGVMMVGGFIVGMFSVTAGYGYAVLANRWWTVPVRETADESGGKVEIPGLEAGAGGVSPPPFWLSVLPIALPVVLIGGAAFLKAFNLPGVPSWVFLLGDKNIGLMIVAGAAMAMLVWVKRVSAGQLAESVGRALSSGGVIILITAAGAVFGSVLRDTGIGDAIQALKLGIPLLPLAYVITAVMRTAQGSATVAMMTSAGIVGSMVGGVDLPYHPVYLALAIGCGSKPISWANDSGFWIIGRMTGMSPVETFKTVSVMMIIMSLVGLAVVVLGSVILPMTPGGG